MMISYKTMMLTMLLRLSKSMDLMIWKYDDADLVFQAVHGPYDPAVFYGKKDLPLREVLASSNP